MPVEIIGVDPRTQIDAIGNVAEVSRVRFRTEKGIEAFINVPRGATNDRVRELVRLKAAELDDLMGEVSA